MGKKFSRRFKVCLTISLAIVAFLGLFLLGVGNDARKIRGGNIYWSSFLNGRSREVGRRGKYVYYIRQSRFHRTKVADVEAARTKEVVSFVTKRLENPDLDRWDLWEIQALLGRDFDESPEETRQWWHESRGDFVSIDEHIQALKSERANQLEAYLQLDKEIHYTEVLAGKWAEDLSDPERRSQLQRNRRLRYILFAHSDSMNERIAHWSPYRRALYNFAFESIFFTLFIFFCGFGLPGIRRRLKAWRTPFWGQLALLCMCVSTFLIFPYIFGYGPTFQDSGGPILYPQIIMIASLPPFLMFGATLHASFNFAFLEISFPPIFGLIDDPTRPWIWTSGIPSVGILLIYSLSYAYAGVLVGLIVSIGRLASKKKTDHKE